MHYITFLLLLLTASGVAEAQRTFDRQAHRGGRGLMPENTIPAMKMALDLGTTLELDLCISKDKQVVVSHDGYISPVFALNPDGSPVTKEQAAVNKLIDLPYSEIVRFDVGSRPHPEFPEQKKMAAHIPLFSELIDAVEAYAKTARQPAPRYNVEVKLQTGNAVWPAFREDFVKATMDVILKKGIEKRVMIQSFDAGMLEMIKRNYPEIKTSYLVGKGDLEANLGKLSFTPDIYSPYYPLVNKDLVDQCHRRKMQIIPWTVNTKVKIDQLKALGVDGIISDFPNLFSK